jgi:hypothetical protein
MSYADAFIPCIKYCITYESTNSSRLVCSLGVKWLRSIMVKNMVNRAAVKGMTETITGLMPIVQSEVSKLQGGEGKEILVETSHSSQKEENGTPEHTKSMANESTNHSQKATPLSRMLSFVWILCILMTIYQIYNQYRYESLMNVGMKWKGVYLRDIEDQLLQKDIALGYVNQG